MITLKASRRRPYVNMTCVALALVPVTLLAVAAGCGGHRRGAPGSATAATNKNAAPPAVSVVAANVSTGSIHRTVSVLGNLQSLYTINLSAKTSGRVVSVMVREGDTVRKGQAVAQIDPTEAQASVQQAEANVLSAESKREQARVQYSQSLINAQVAVQNARLAVSASRIALQKTITGGQPQQKQQAKDQLLQQEANFENARLTFNRQKQLYDQGAIAKADLDNAQTQYKVQEALLDSYKQNLALTLAGGRAEDVATSRSQLAQSEQSLRNAIANQAQTRVDKQAILGASAFLVQQKALLASARQQLRDTTVVSPINGMVASKSVDTGQIATPGTTLVQVVDLNTMYFEPSVSETDFRSIGPGQRVTVSVDAYPGRAFLGAITTIYPSANAQNRQFTARVNLANPGRLLRPGMYARGSVLVATHANVVIVPVSALLPRERAAGYEANAGSSGTATGAASLPPQKVFVLGPGSKARERDVQVGIVSGENAEVTSGLRPGEQLIVKGQGQIQDGDPVKRTPNA